MIKTKYIDGIRYGIKEKYRTIRENSSRIKELEKAKQSLKSFAKDNKCAGEFIQDSVLARKLRLLESEQKNLKAEVKILQSVYSYLKFKKDGCVRDGEVYFLQALSSIIIELKEHGFRGSVDHLMEEYFFTGKGSIIRELLSAGVRPSNIKKVIGEGDGMSNEDLNLLDKLVKIEEQRIERKRRNAVSNQNNR
jgi:hypothetical protein